MSSDLIRSFADGFALGCRETWAPFWRGFRCGAHEGRADLLRLVGVRR